MAKRKTGAPKGRPSNRKRKVQPLRWSELPQISRVVSFFQAAEMSTAWSSDTQLVVETVTFPTTGVPRDARFVDWDGRINRFVMEHFLERFSRSVLEWGPPVYDEDETHLLADGVELLSSGNVVYRIHPTSASVPGDGVILGNFLMPGSHWDQLEAAVEARYAVIESGVNDRLSRLLQVEIPGISPLLLREAPAGLSASIRELCQVASEDIRLHRQLALDRPAVLWAGRARLRISPLAGDDELLVCPFALNVGHAEAQGAIVLPADIDPVPVVLDRRTSGELQRAAWSLALLGFAALSVPEGDDDAPVVASPPRLRARNGRRRAPSIPRERSLPRPRRFFSHSLDPVGGHAHAACFVAGHRRKLYDGRQASKEAIARAAAVGIILRPSETWVRPFARGLATEPEIEFNWQCPGEGLTMIDKLTARAGA